MESMKTIPIRLTPGQDLRAALEAAVLAHSCRAAFVLSGIGACPPQASGWRGRRSPRG